MKHNKLKLILLATLLSSSCINRTPNIIPAASNKTRTKVINLLQDAKEGIQDSYNKDWVQGGDLRYAEIILDATIKSSRTAVDPKSMSLTLLAQAEGLMPNDGGGQDTLTGKDRYGDPNQAIHDSRLRVYFDDLQAKIKLVK